MGTLGEGVGSSLKTEQKTSIPKRNRETYEREIGSRENQTIKGKTDSEKLANRSDGEFDPGSG